MKKVELNAIFDELNTEQKKAIGEYISETANMLADIYRKGMIEGIIAGRCWSDYHCWRMRLY